MKAKIHGMKREEAEKVWQRTKINNWIRESNENGTNDVATEHEEKKKNYIAS